MAKIILKSPYLKPNAKSHISNYVNYIATREGVEKPIDSKLNLQSTLFQQKTITQLINDYPDIIDLYEYTDYLKKPSRENADEFIMRVAETHNELFGSRQKYVDYIATRPNVVHIANHGLFTDEGKAVILKDAVQAVSDHKGNIWTHIISLRREDADRLGYSDVSNWQELLRSNRNTFATQMKIKPENFRWYAAFHNSDHHPHIHMVAYSIDPKEAYLTEEGILNIKSALAKDIFRQDNISIYEKQTKIRNTLRTDSRKIMSEIIEQINSGMFENNKVEELLTKLAERLKVSSRKKQYGYLKPDDKAIVDRVVDELAKNKSIAKLYDLWYEQKFETIRNYTDTMPERLPLSQNKEYKSIKNAVIQEALNILYDRNTFEEVITDDGTASVVIQKNPNELERFIESTEEQKNSQAKYLLGKLYLSEDGIPKNVQKAVYWLTESANQENQYAQYQLGKMYLYGKDVTQDSDQAVRLLTLSASQGNQYATMILRNYNTGRNPVSTFASLRLIGQLSKLFRENVCCDQDGQKIQTERKLIKQIEEKKHAHGLKMD